MTSLNDIVTAYAAANAAEATYNAGKALLQATYTEAQIMAAGSGTYNEGLKALADTPTAPTVTTTTLNAMTDTVAFSQQLAATGNPVPTWSVTAGTIVSGLSLSSGGLTSGTPDTAGAYDFTVAATNSEGSDVQQYTGTVAVFVAPTITTATLESLNEDVAFSQTLVATGDTPITWAVTAGTIVPGLSLSSAGVLSGTPTAAGAYDFTVTATNAGGSDPQQYTGTVGAAPVAPTVTTTTLDAMTVDSAFSQVLAATGDATITWAVTAGTLPAGLSLSSGGTLSGTPTTAGAYSFTVTATNSAGNDTQAFSGSVEAPSSGLFWFGTKTPDTDTIYSDGGANIIAGDRFYGTVPFNVLGLRLWNPSDADSTLLNTDVTAYAYAQDWTGTALNHTSGDPDWASPDRTKTITAARVAGEWTEFLFDTPLAINAINSGANDPDVVLLAVRYSTAGYYVICTDSTVTSSASPSAAADGVFMAEDVLVRVAITLNGTTGSAPVSKEPWYGIDLIYELA